jgi:hypothetical protein
MIFEIPIVPTDADFVQTISLDGSAYQLTFSWSTRSESWYLDVFRLNDDSDPAPVVAGARLSPGYPLLMGVTGTARPPGDLFLLDLNVQGDPTRTDLGSRAKLYYFDLDSLSV